MLCFYSAKGGVGCSLVAAAAAVLSSRSRSTLLVDLAGDLGHVLGVSVPGDAGVPAGGHRSGPPGLAQWFEAPDPLPDALHFLEVPVREGLGLLPFGSGRPAADDDRARTLADLLVSDGRRVIVDLGTNGGRLLPLLEAAERGLLVTRACYLALRAAMHVPRPDEVVLVAEPGRALTAKDVTGVVGAPVVASVPWLPAIARAVDAGLLATRVPGSLKRLDVLYGAEVER